MSKLVQQWEQSYKFTENELALLADTQKRLAQPLVIPEVIKNGKHWIKLIGHGVGNSSAHTLWGNLQYGKIDLGILLFKRS